MNYHNLYIKYKKKYLNLRNNLNGGVTSNPYFSDSSDDEVDTPRGRMSKKKVERRLREEDERRRRKEEERKKKEELELKKKEALKDIEKKVENNEITDEEHYRLTRAINSSDSIEELLESLSNSDPSSEQSSKSSESENSAYFFKKLGLELEEEDQELSKINQDYNKAKLLKDQEPLKFKASPLPESPRSGRSSALTIEIEKIEKEKEKEKILEKDDGEENFIDIVYDEMEYKYRSKILIYKLAYSIYKAIDSLERKGLGDINKKDMIKEFIDICTIIFKELDERKNNEDTIRIIYPDPFTITKSEVYIKKFFPSGLAEKAENLTIRDNFHYSTDGILFEFYNQFTKKTIIVSILKGLDYDKEKNIRKSYDKILQNMKTEDYTKIGSNTRNDFIELLKYEEYEKI